MVVSWGWNRDVVAPAGSPDAADERRDLAIPPEQGGTSRLIDEREWQGTRDPAAYLSVPAAIQFQAEHDWPRVRQESHELLREARRRIEALTGLPAICPETDLPGLTNLSGLHTWYAQMAAFPLPACAGAALQRRLRDQYPVEVPIIEWNGRQLVRMSVQGYNTLEDVEALAEGLEKLLA